MWGVVNTNTLPNVGDEFPIDFTVLGNTGINSVYRLVIRATIPKDIEPPVAYFIDRYEFIGPTLIDTYVDAEMTDRKKMGRAVPDIWFSNNPDIWTAAVPVPGVAPTGSNGLGFSTANWDFGRIMQDGYPRLKHSVTGVLLEGQ